MKNNKFIKITLDSILILLTLGLFTMNFSNPTINKILGIAIFILTIIHIILHKDNLFMKKIPINDYNSYYNNVHNKIYSNHPKLLPPFSPWEIVFCEIRDC